LKKEVEDIVRREESRGRGRCLRVVREREALTQRDLHGRRPDFKSPIYS
jgi:hypothetical protein